MKRKTGSSIERAVRNHFLKDSPLIKPGKHSDPGKKIKGSFQDDHLISFLPLQGYPSSGDIVDEPTTLRKPQTKKNQVSKLILKQGTQGAHSRQINISALANYVGTQALCSARDNFAVRDGRLR